jgi:hypothetical protein
MGLGRQLERQLCFLAHNWSPTAQCILSYDFAPYSFSFCRYTLPTDGAGERKFSYNGAMIYQGPNCPADGSFPSYSRATILSIEKSSRRYSPSSRRSAPMSDSSRLMSMGRSL